MSNRRNRNVAQEQDNSFDLSIIPAETTNVVTAKKQAVKTVNEDIGSLGTVFGSIRRNRAETQAAIEEAVQMGKKLDKAALHRILNVGDFNLFRHFMTEKERERTTFKGGTAYNILFRAASNTKKYKEQREAYIAENPA